MYMYMLNGTLQQVFLNKDWQPTIVSIMRPQWTNQCNKLHIRSRRSKPRMSKSIFWCNPARMETVILYFVTRLYCLRKTHSVGKSPEGVKFLRGEVELLLRDGVRVNLWGRRRSTETAAWSTTGSSNLSDVILHAWRLLTEERTERCGFSCIIRKFLTIWSCWSLR